MNANPFPPELAQGHYSLLGKAEGMREEDSRGKVSRVPITARLTGKAFN